MTRMCCLLPAFSITLSWDAREESRSNSVEINCNHSTQRKILRSNWVISNNKIHIDKKKHKFLLNLIHPKKSYTDTQNDHSSPSSVVVLHPININWELASGHNHIYINKSGIFCLAWALQLSTARIQNSVSTKVSPAFCFTASR